MGLSIYSRGNYFGLLACFLASVFTKTNRPYQCREFSKAFSGFWQLVFSRGVGVLSGFGFDPSNRNWLLDNWHLGPLRLINLCATGWVIAKSLRYLERWEIPLRPFSLIGRHMVLFFCCENCLSILLIGIVESPRGGEPLTSFLVICQVLTAFLLAWFFDERSHCKNSPASQRSLDSPALQPELLKAGR